MNIVLLDANVVIWLHEHKRFEALLKNHRILLTETIANETKYYEDKYGQKKHIDFSTYIKENKLEIIKDAPIEEIKDLHNRVIGKGLCELHAGESSCIQLVINNPNYKFCTGEPNVFIVMGYLGLAKQAVSLEELLGRLTDMAQEYTRGVFDKKIKEGKIKRVQSL